MQNLHYRVAELDIRVDIPDGLDPAGMFPSFVPFAVQDDCVQADLTVDTCCELSVPDGMEPVVRETNDMGLTEIFNTESGCLLRFSFMGLTSLLRLCDGFGRAEICTDFSHRAAGYVISCMVRTAFAQTIALHDGLSLHSSTVINDGRGYMFMGTSGTGKSTHSRLWMSAFPGTWLINDDNPMVRFIDGTLMVFGSPWSGKTHCYRNASAPVAAIVRLSQAPENSIKILQSVEAFIEVYQGTSVLRTDPQLHDRMCDTVSRITESGVRVAHLRCLPDEAAARLCHDSLQ